MQENQTLAGQEGVSCGVAKKTKMKREWHVGWKKLKLSILKRDQFKCVKCSYTPPSINVSKYGHLNLEVHHIVELRNGGTTTPENLQTICRQCHEKEHPEERPHTLYISDPRYAE